jgi:hypothetical protein
MAGFRDDAGGMAAGAGMMMGVQKNDDGGT